MIEASSFGQTQPSSDELLEPLLRGFSCPQEGLDEAFLEFVAVEHARQTARFFLQRYAVELNQRGQGLVDFLDSWLNGETGFAAVWDISWGDIYRMLQVTNASDLAFAAASVALWLGACGMPGEWTLTRESPVRLRWSHWLLPVADWIAVQCDGKSSYISLCLGDAKQEINFERTAEGWEGDGAQIMPEFGTRREKIILLPSAALVTDNFGILRTLAVPEIQSEMVATCKDTMAFLHKYAPVYFQWVLRILRHVILLKSNSVSIRSGSSREEPGLIHMSYTSNLTSLAESLVHEASHQYLNVLCWLGTIDDGSDTNLYYSPVKQKKRSLYRIALSYHAFANILLFYRLCRANGAPDDGFCARNEPTIAAQVRELEAPLRNNPALTSIGQALCKPLMERLG